MPGISRFFGIVIRMYFDDHSPPHFHAFYGDREAQVGIQPIALLNGALPAGPHPWYLNGQCCIKGI